MIEGVGSKPLSVSFATDRIQLCVLPAPKRAASKGLFELAPMGLLVSAIIRQSRLFRFIVHTHNRSFLQQSLPSQIPYVRPFALWRGDFPQGRTLSAILLLPQTPSTSNHFQSSHVCLWSLPSFVRIIISLTGIASIRVELLLHIMLILIGWNCKVYNI